MFGFFKRDLREIDAFKYQMIAASASANALGVTVAMLAQSSKRDEETFQLLYHEALAFAVCLSQMRIQDKFKLNDGNDILAIIQEIQRQFRDLPVPRDAGSGQGIPLTREMLDNATTDAFLELVAYYAARDYRALDITDETVEAFCKITRQIPSIIKGAGWTMALLIFQIRTVGILFDESELLDEGSNDQLSQQLPAVLTAAKDGCQFLTEKFDHVLNQ